MFFSVLLLVFVVALVNYALSRVRFGPARTEYDYDVIIVGGSIAGPVIAKALSDQNRKVLLLERTLFAKPDRIVGEVLQPGGIRALKQVKMEGCATFSGVSCKGYVVHDEFGRCVRLPYSGGLQGNSFHFGDFVCNLRKHVWDNCAANVTMLQGTVNKVLVEHCGCLERAYGVEYSVDPQFEAPESPFGKTTTTTTTGLAEGPSATTERRVATAPLIIMCDGGSSKFKAGYEHYTPARQYHSHFIGLILHDVQLPVEGYGVVFVCKTGPIVSYRLDPKELRMLVDYKGPTLPSLEEQSRWLVEEVAPSLPESIRTEFIRVACDKNNIRSMPIACYFSTFPSIRGYVGIGDHANQRHPLTGGGMTCAFNDALHLARELSAVPKMRSKDVAEMANIEDAIQKAVVRYVQRRLWHSSCVNLLSWALYAVFSVPVLRRACFDYFLLGGDCVDGPMALLSGVNFNPVCLLFHYLSVMAYGIFCAITGSGVYTSGGRPATTLGEKCLNATVFLLHPIRLAGAFYIFFMYVWVAVPLVYGEFVSPWRLMDPTGFIPNLARRAKNIFYCAFLNGKQRKPTGL